jgi:hypothetical protein
MALPVTPGYYSEPEAETYDTRYFQSPCQPGYYCSGGVRKQCPAGRYGSTPLLQGEDCSGLCAPGYVLHVGCGDLAAFRVLRWGCVDRDGGGHMGRALNGG